MLLFHFCLYLRFFYFYSADTNTKAVGFDVSATQKIPALTRQTCTDFRQLVTMMSAPLDHVKIIYDFIPAFKASIASKLDMH